MAYTENAIRIREKRRKQQNDSAHWLIITQAQKVRMVCRNSSGHRNIFDELNICNTFETARKISLIQNALLQLYIYFRYPSNDTLFENQGA